eukprot:m.224471 g.224471  ORF g.224471 m.224471 type:complete len:50 (+) comp83855_c0_seq1:187-336(+)
MTRHPLNPANGMIQSLHHTEVASFIDDKFKAAAITAIANSTWACGILLP